MLKYPKRFTKDQKSSILSQHLEEGLSISELSRKYQVSAHTIYKWRNAMKEQQSEDKRISLDTDQLLSEIEQLIPVRFEFLSFHKMKIISNQCRKLLFVFSDPSQKQHQFFLKCLQIRKISVRHHLLLHKFPQPLYRI